MKKVTSLLMALILSVTILMGSIPMNASAATTEVPVGWYQQGKKDITIVVNTKTHNATLYAKDKKTGKYNIPLKTMVCSKVVI